MRALVLAGGEGSRLRPLTHTQAKQLIPIPGQPILFHALDAIRDAGIRRSASVIGQTGPEVRAAVDDATTVDGVAVVAPGAKVTASTSIGPVCIGEDCMIDRSTIGADVSIEPRSTVRGSTIRDGIVMAGRTVGGVCALESSTLGRNTDVRRAGGGGAHRLVVGDQSRVEVD